MPDEQPTHVIYAGTTIPGVLTQGAVYELPFGPHIQAVLDAKPTIKGFFTTPEKFLSHTQRMGIKVGALTLPKGRYIRRKGAR